MEEKFNLGIKKIKDIGFFIDETVGLPEPANLGIGFELTTNVNLHDATIDLILQVIFKDNPNDKELMRIKTINSFFIPEITSFKQESAEQFKLPDILLVTILGLSVSHTRALLAKNTTGTRFADIYIPIVNPTELAKQLFGINSK
jgi:hypothetical protein